MVPFIALLVWYAVTRGLIDPSKLPKPEAVVRSFIEIIDLLPAATWASLRMVLLGMALGTVYRAGHRHHLRLQLFHPSLLRGNP